MLEKHQGSAWCECSDQSKMEGETISNCASGQVVQGLETVARMLHFTQ